MRKREIVAALRDALRDVDERAARLELERTGLETAIDAINGLAPGEGRSKKTGLKKRQRRPRKPQAHYENTVLDYLRAHPDEGFALADLSRGISHEPTNSIRRAAIRLVDSGRVRTLGKNARGVPIVTYRPTAITPGEAVMS